jgi:Cation transport ATPase (P-type)
VKREVEGDASETGLIKFVQPLLMGGHYGCYKKGGIDGFRKSYPDLAMIPFSSDIKFNLIIRDM